MKEAIQVTMTSQHQMKTNKTQLIKRQLFKCKIKNCARRLTSRKALYQHHKATHRGDYINVQTCDKKYRTPYSLYQHNLYS